MSYEIMTPETLPKYLLSIPAIADFFETDEIETEEIGDGNLNFVFVARSVKEPQKSLIVKQAVPYLRCAGEEYSLSRERMKFEIRALQSYDIHAPKIYHADEEMSLVVMEHLKSHKILRKGLIQKERYDLFADHISTFLARTLFKTSSLYLQSDEKRALMERFNENRELCRLTEDFVFTFPYMQNETNHIEPGCEEEARELFEDYEFKQKVLGLKYIFMTQADALLHGDLHTGSIMVNEKETFVIDPEFAFVGPFGFDIGAVLANLGSAYISHRHVSGDSEYMEWIEQNMVDVWSGFERKFLDLWRERERSALIEPGFLPEEPLESFRREFMRDILRQSAGFAGCKMARRVFGIAGVEEIRGIEDRTLRKRAMMDALECGKSLVMEHEKIESIEDIVAIVKGLS
ncbi:5-methylthioribose kinase [Hydrogenimonas sp.]|nr:5-methylthioribose kinase [Hydrogenimonas sp.]